MVSPERIGIFRRNEGRPSMWLEQHDLIREKQVVWCGILIRYVEGKTYIRQGEK